MNHLISRFGVLSLVGLSFLAQARVLVVNSADNTASAPGQTNLVQAIALLQDGDTINFNLPGTGPFYLVTPPLDPDNGYPAITNHNVTIDGYSQPGAEPNTHTILASNNAHLQIVLDSRRGGLHREDLPGLSLQEASVLLVKGATNVTLRGLSFLGPGFGEFTAASPASYAVSFATGATHGHVEGCWLGLEPNRYEVFPFAAGVTSFQSSAGDGTTIGVDPQAPSPAVARSQFNLFLGEFIPVILEGKNLRISGNFFNVFPDGKTDFLADGTPDHLLQAFIETDSADNLVIGTDGDGVNDAEERNVFGGVVFAYDNKLIEWYGRTGTNMVVAGNYFGLGVDGITRFTNSVPVFGTVESYGSLRIGSDFDGVSDALEGNVINLNYPFSLLFPAPAGGAAPEFLDAQPGAQISLRGNRLIGSTLAPFTYADGAGGRLIALTNYFAPFLDTAQTLMPQLAMNSTSARLRGRCPTGIAPFTNIVVDVYLADEEAWTNGQSFQLPELSYTDPATSATSYYGFAQGREYLGSFTDNGPQDLNPAVGVFEFDISALNLARTAWVTVAANYSATAPGAHNGLAHTSNFSLPIPLPNAPRISLAWLGANLVLSWPTNAGIFNLQSTPQLSPSAWADLIPQPALQVHGAIYEAALPMDDRQKFFRLAQ